MILGPNWSVADDGWPVLAIAGVITIFSEYHLSAAWLFSAWFNGLADALVACAEPPYQC